MRVFAHCCEWCLYVLRREHHLLCCVFPRHLSWPHAFPILTRILRNFREAVFSPLFFVIIMEKHTLQQDISVIFLILPRQLHLGSRVDREVVWIYMYLCLR